MSDYDEHDVFQETLKELIFQGKKIEAIKKYREQTGMGLKESKEAVEAMTAQLRADYPDQVQEGVSGCAPMILFAFISLASLITYGLA